MRQSQHLLPNIQIMRGLAALLVSISHISSSLAHANLPATVPGSEFGFFGVDLFFVISGFIMHYVAKSDHGLSAARQFMIRRIIRIVPLYWIFLGVTLLIVLHVDRHYGMPTFQIWHTIASFCFIPFPEMQGGTDIYPIYGVGWTLNYEMFFYVCFAISMLLPDRSRLPILAAFFITLFVAGSLTPLPLPFSSWAQSNILEFVMGMGIAWAYLRGARLTAKPALALALGGLAGALVFVPYNDAWDSLRGLGWGLPAAAIVASGALFTRTNSDRLARAFEKLGDVSYSLYLIHPMVYDAVLFLFWGAIVSHGLHLRFVVTIMLAGAVLGSFGLYAFLERPLTRALQKRWLKNPDGFPAVPLRLSSERSAAA